VFLVCDDLIKQVLNFSSAARHIVSYIISKGQDYGDVCARNNKGAKQYAKAKNRKAKKPGQREMFSAGV